MTDETHVVARSTKELLQALELDEIYYVAITAERQPDSSPDLLDGPQVGHQAMDRRNESELQVRVESTIQAHDAKYVIDLVARYVAEGTYEVEGDGIVKDFIERVAMMALWPYIRQQVSDLSSTFRTEHITLPLLRPGDVVFEVTPPED